MRGISWQQGRFGKGELKEGNEELYFDKILLLSAMVHARANSGRASRWLLAGSSADSPNRLATCFCHWKLGGRNPAPPSPPTCRDRRASARFSRLQPASIQARDEADVQTKTNTTYASRSDCSVHIYGVHGRTFLDRPVGCGYGGALHKVAGSTNAFSRR